MELYLIRHTTPQVGMGVCYGQTDLDVADSFQTELVNIRKKVAHLESPHIYSSPLQRCAKLATALAGNLQVKHDARLKELNFGDWEMLPWDQIPRGAIDVWADEHVKQAPPNGESFYSLHLRASQFLTEVSANRRGTEVVVVTHAGVIRALLAEALGLPLQNAFKLQLAYGSVSHVSVDDATSRINFINL